MKNFRIVICLLSAFLCYTCIVQPPGIPKLKNTQGSFDSTSTLAISAKYKMNLGVSNDVRFYFLEVNSKKLYAPQNRDKQNNHFYFNVPPGNYKISLIQIKDPSISKHILFNDSTNTIVKALGQANNALVPASRGGQMSGIGLSGTILFGDKEQVFLDSISCTIKIEPNKSYYLGEYQLRGYVGGGITLPDIEILQSEQIPSKKMESFYDISSDINSNYTIDTVQSIFNTPIIKLYKVDAIGSKGIHSRY